MITTSWRSLESLGSYITAMVFTIFVSIYICRKTEPVGYIKRNGGVGLALKVNQEVDGKRMQRAAEKVLRNIFYLHVPKCGTSFSTVLVQYACPSFPKNRIVGSPSLLEFPEGQRMNYTKFCGNRFKRFTGGHPPLPANLRYNFNESLDIVTFLRNPVDRIISGFLHNFHGCNVDSIATTRSWLFPGIAPKDVKPGQTSPNYSALFSEKYFQDLAIVYRFYWDCVKGSATRMIIGQSYGDSWKRSPLTSHEIEISIQRIKRFSFVGLNDKWNESIRLWRCMFGADYSEYILVNTRPSEHSNLKDTLYNLTKALKLTDEADGILYHFAEAQFAFREQKYCGVGETH